MKQYLDLVRHVLNTGTRKENRTGIDSLSTFGYYYEHDLRDGFPLLTTKRIEWMHIVIELLWFLSGSNRSGFLERHGIKFWRPWYDKSEPAARGAGRKADVPVNAAYGPAWRRFEYPQWCESKESYVVGWNDQVKWVVEQLREKPLRRDLVVSAWQPHIAQYPPTSKTYWAPCHCMWILNVQNDVQMREAPPLKGCGIGQEIKQRLCLHLTQRSCDVGLGVCYNIASYSLLLSLLARFSGIEPGIFGHTLVDAHIYCAKPDGSMAEYDHIPGLMEQLTREPRPLPTLRIDDSIQTLEDVERLLHPMVTTDQIMSKFVLEGYNPWPAIPLRVAV